MELPSIQELKSFILYGQLRNFTSAAKAANVTQSAFRAQIKKLEDILGVPLIIRNNRGSALTVEGERFLRDAEAVVASLETAAERVRRLYARRLPVLHVGVMRSMGDILMNAHIAYLHAHHEDLSINVYDMEESEVMTDLHAGKIDMASVYADDAARWHGYEMVPFATDSFVYFAPHVAPGGAVSKEFMWNRQLVMYLPKYFMDRRLRTYFAGTETSGSHAEIQLSNPYASVDFCRNNKAGCLVSERLAAVMGLAGQCRALADPLTLTAYIVYRKHTEKETYIRLFIEYMRKRGSRLPARSHRIF